MDAPRAAPELAPDAKPVDPFLGGPLFDAVFLVGAPLYCLALLWFFWTFGMVAENGGSSFSGLYLNTMLTGHLLLTFVRSHANKTVFVQFPVRFTAVPIAMYLAMATIAPFRIFMALVLGLWGHWHAWQQTFGLARIYDAKIGNSATKGRELDFWLCLVMWMGPLLSGAVYAPQAELLGRDIAPLHAGLGQTLPTVAALWGPRISQLTIVASGAFLVWYAYSYYRLSKQGYRVSGLKIALLLGTGIIQLIGHGYDPGGQSRFITVVFHYWQYFAIMWVLEGGNLTRLLRLDRFSRGRAVTLGLFLSLPLIGGLWISSHAMTTPWILSGVMLLSFLHFWYDGFMWSVRKKMV